MTWFSHSTGGGARHAITVYDPAFSVRPSGKASDASANTAGLQAALDTAWTNGGGTVLVPPLGPLDTKSVIYLNGSITLRKGVSLILAPNIVLRATTGGTWAVDAFRAAGANGNPDKPGFIDPLTGDEFTGGLTAMFTSDFGDPLNDVEITGGEIDANAQCDITLWNKAARNAFIHHITLAGGLYSGLMINTQDKAFGDNSGTNTYTAIRAVAGKTGARRVRANYGIMYARGGNDDRFGPETQVEDFAVGFYGQVFSGKFDEWHISAYADLLLTSPGPLLYGAIIDGGRCHISRWQVDSPFVAAFRMKQGPHKITAATVTASADKEGKKEQIPHDTVRLVEVKKGASVIVDGALLNRDGSLDFKADPIGKNTERVIARNIVRTADRLGLPADDGHERDPDYYEGAREVGITLVINPGTVPSATRAVNLDKVTRVSDAEYIVQLRFAHRVPGVAWAVSARMADGSAVLCTIKAATKRRITVRTTTLAGVAVTAAEIRIDVNSGGRGSANLFRAWLGPSDQATLDSAGIVALEDSLITAGGLSEDEVAIATGYLYAAVPAALGTVTTMTVNGSAVTPTLTTVSVTDDGDTEDYTVARTPTTYAAGVYTVALAITATKPVCIQDPAITGLGRVGTPMTAETGIWIGPAASYAYQQIIDGVDLPGVTTATYTPVTADRNKVLSTRVTATNANGSVSRTSAGRQISA